MSSPGVTSSRSWPIPDGAHTLHLIGDMHFGVNRQFRMDHIPYDANSSPTIGNILGHVAIGDITDHGTSNEDALALATLAQLPKPWFPVMGGHDIQDDVRTPAQWAQVYGVAAENYTVDFDAFRLIVIGPDRYRNTLPATAVSYLDTALGATTKPCIIATHQPLANTVGGDNTIYYSSFDNGWGYARTSIDPVLASHANAKVWMSGHTHSSLDAPGFVCPITVGGRTMVHVNGSSPHYQDRTGATALDQRFLPIPGVYVTLLDDRVQVRFREHGSQAWVGPEAVGRVWEVML